jgi:transposase-like protein
MKRLAAKVTELTHAQRQALMRQLAAIEGQTASVGVIEDRMGSVCPHCGGTRMVRNGHAHGLQRYKCRGCQRSFNALTGTPLARLRQKGKWLAQAEAVREGLTIKQAAAKLQVAPSTAFRWRHRFLALPKTVHAQVLSGIAEADQTYFLHSMKGQRKITRKPRRRGGKAAKRGLSKEQVPVLVARDRAGATADFVLEADSKDQVAAALKPILAVDAILCTDASGMLAAVAKELGIAHRPVNVSAGQRVVAGVYHIQNVNAYDSRLKNWMRRFHGVATKYLDSYLGWFRTLDRSAGTNLKPACLLEMAISV